MNAMVEQIYEIVCVTCLHHQLDKTEFEKRSLANMAWLESGGDKEKIIDYLAKEMRLE